MIDSKVITEYIVIQISYRFGISGVIDVILELIAPVSVFRIMTT